MERNELCWCGSGKKYKKCHLAFDERLQSMYEQGFELPDRASLKSAADIEGIKRSAAINIGVLDYVAEDYMVLADYIRSFPVDEKTGLPTITAGSGYADVYGSGRITILRGGEVTGQDNETEVPAAEEYIVQTGDSLWKIAKTHYGNGRYWETLYEANADRIADPDLVFVGQILFLPAA